jgi:SNF2 family DNA or RNA helicase
MITKTANSELKDYQQRVLDKLYGSDDSPHGLIAYHSTGSGKTLTALSALQKAMQDKSDRALWVAPASLTSNFEKEKQKHGITFPGNVDVYSYEKARSIADELAKNKYKLTVLDEAHKLRNQDTGAATKLKPILGNSDKVLALTGTASYNDPVDTMNLIKLIDKNAPVITDKKKFYKSYVFPEKWTLKPKGKKELKEILNKYVDVYDTPQNSSDFPTVTHKDVQVEMSPHQVEMYDYFMRKLPSDLRLKVTRKLPMSPQDAGKLNSFSTAVREVSDSTAPFRKDIPIDDSTKLQLAAKNLLNMAKDNDNFRGLAYSNFLGAGLEPYKEILSKKGIQPLLFTGDLGKKQKNAIVSDYNTPGGKKVMLLSSSGGEGLDLKNTRLIQILEPHFNKSKIKQVEGRGARYQSHIGLPEKDRNVLIEHYTSTLPRTMLQKALGKSSDTSIDEYLNYLSDKKQRLSDEIKGLVE